MSVLVKQQGRRERRHHPRYALNCEFRGTKLSLLGAAKRTRGIIRGEIQNISAGGLCVLVDRPVKEFHLVRGEVLLPELAAGIPALTQVRWGEQVGQGSRYRMGLQFLLS